MFEAWTISVSVAQPWRDFYEAIWKPETFPMWASGLSKSLLEQDGDSWKAEGSQGSVRIRFTGHNLLGIMDHYVEVGGGQEIHVPLRVVSNANGAEVLLTVFRQPEKSEAKFLVVRSRQEHPYGRVNRPIKTRASGYSSAALSVGL